MRNAESERAGQLVNAMLDLAPLWMLRMVLENNGLQSPPLDLAITLELGRILPLVSPPKDVTLEIFPPKPSE